MNDLILSLLQALVEVIFTMTGRGLWGLVGLRPYDIVAMISGMIFGPSWPYSRTPGCTARKLKAGLPTRVPADALLPK